MIREDIIQYRYNLGLDLNRLGCDGGRSDGNYDGMSARELWESTRTTIAVDTRHASLDYGPVEPSYMHTKFGRQLLALVRTTPYSSLNISGSHTMNIVCGNAEPGFMRSLIPATHDHNAPLLLARNGQIDAMMKFNAGGEHTILGLTDDDTIVAGGLYGVPSIVDESLVHAQAGKGLAIVEMADFYEAVSNINDGRPAVYAQRQTSFMIDDDIRAGFAEALYKTPNEIRGIKDMYSDVNRLATNHEKAARARGQMILELLAGER